MPVNTLAQTWTQIELLLQQGISVIPIWDSDRLVNGEQVLRKAACFKWKEYQQKIITKEELWLQMERANTSAVAMVCGTVSGNLEVIDVDVKYKPGVDAQLFSDLKELYPQIYSRLRIHRTPSGGYHIPFRIAGHAAPGNTKLARREKSEQELLAEPKPKTVCYIETRGEGGYVAAPPSLGYEVIKNQPIPELSWEERTAIVTLCTTYNEQIVVEKPPAQTQREASYYDETPFEHFNRACDPVQLLTQFGWQFIKHSGAYLWFSRPGASRATDVHASFNTEKRFYYIFSTNASGLDSDRAYLPSTVYALLGFQADKQRAYASLVQQGYGRIKPSVEKQLVKKLVLRAQQLPANASAEAATAYIEQRANLDEQHPFGVFWRPADAGPGFQIEREKLYAVAEGLGFRVWQQETVQLAGHQVTRRTEREFYDTLKQYINEEDGEIYSEICNAYEAFIQKNGAFTQTRLAFLDTALLLSDTKTACYKFYTNGYVEITRNSIVLHSYAQLSGRLVWAERIQQREYAPAASTDCLYTKFLARAIANDEEHLQAVIGYLAHEFKDETIGYIIVLTEEVADPKLGGGTGKNIFSSLFSHTTTFKSIPGALVKYDEKFLQAWDYERVLAISDAPKKFEFTFLKEMTTGTGKVKKLFKNEVTIPVELMPKFIVSTQFSYEVTDGGLRRRIIPLEFTDFFTKSGGVDVYFKKHFPQGWSAADWAGYDFFIAGCVQTWLRNGLKLSDASLSTTGKQKQFEQTYGRSLYEFFSDHIEEWVETGRVEINKFRQSWAEFCAENDIPKTFQPSTQKINNALSEFCAEKAIEFEASHQWFQSGIKFRGKLFIKPAPF